MKGPSVRKDLYQDRLGSLPSKSTDVQHAAHSLAALVNTQKALVRCWSPLMLLPNHAAKKRLHDTDLWAPSYVES